MAGNYPDPIGRRMAWDKDGTALVTINNVNAITQRTTVEKQNINNETSGTGLNPNQLVTAVIFPELRDIVGLMVYALNHSAWETSVNTTNGLDGTWVSRTTPVEATNSAPGYRNGQVSAGWTSIKAIRFYSFGINYNLKLHLYGDMTAGQTPDRLRVWHPTLDQIIPPAHLDWGNVPRGSSADRQFRVKNNSSTLTANTVTVSIEALSDTTPSVPGQYSFSFDGITFTSTVQIASLGPGAISAPITVRRVTPSNATLSLWTTRIIAEAVSFS